MTEGPIWFLGKDNVSYSIINFTHPYCKTKDTKMKVPMSALIKEAQDWTQQELLNFYNEVLNEEKVDHDLLSIIRDFAVYMHKMEAQLKEFEGLEEAHRNLITEGLFGEWK